MKELVYIKSFPKGLKLHLDEEMEFDELLAEVAQRFEDSRKFFGEAYLALAIEGRALSDAEEVKILDVIDAHSDIKIICLVNKDQEKNIKFEKSISELERRMVGNKEGHFLKGSLKDGEVLETDTSIIIIGDVAKGCAVISSKNIIVLGGLYGEAYAGGDGQPGAYIAALEMAPERLKIGDFKYKPEEKKSLFAKKKKKVQSEMAFVKDGEIIFQSITKDLLGNF